MKNWLIIAACWLVAGIAATAAAQQAPPADLGKYLQPVRQQRDQAQQQAADLAAELQVAKQDATVAAAKAAAIAKWWGPVWTALVAAKSPVPVPPAKTGESRIMPASPVSPHK